MAAKNQLIKVDGIDVTSFRTNTLLEDTIEDQSDKLTIMFNYNVNTLITLATFQSVEVWENYSGTLETDANRVFKGVISKIEREPSRVKVYVFGELWKAVQSEVNKTYDRNIDPEAGKGSEIFKNLCDLADLNYDNSTIIDTGSTIVLDKFVCAKCEVFERMRTLAEIWGYQIYYNSREDKVHFEPIGYISNSNPIYIGGSSNNVQRLTKWKEDGTTLFNKIELIGAYQEVQKTESFDGTGIQTTFTLTEEPQITEVTVGGVQQIGGTTGSTLTFDYTVDKQNKEIIFQSGSIPGAGSGNVVVFYSYRAPRPVVLTNSSSVTEVGRTIKRVFTFNDIQEVDDAETRARDLLNVYSQPFIYTVCTPTPSQTETAIYEVGQIVNVQDVRESINRNMVIKRKVSKYPESDVTLEIGDKDVRVGDLERDTTIRLKRLEEELAKAGTFIVEVVDTNNTIDVSNRSFETQIRTIGTAFVLGHPDNAVLGTSTLGEGTLSSWLTDSIFQADNAYKEDFRDDDFKAVATTATWDNSGRKLDFTSGQVGESTSIDYNNGTILGARMTITETSGTYTLELSADGGNNWETVVNNTNYIFTNTGTDLRWRITESTASTGSITLIQVEGYH